ncbi:MAG: diguanylate cyclase [Arcobacteraceae bacterium]|nr:diguanylate cyclase [Arcobacteraceae bacterium]
MRNIIKNTFFQLKKKGLIATPDNYFQEFAIQAKTASKDIYECKVFDDILTNLTPPEQQQAQKDNITTFSDLATLLTKRFDNLKGFAFILNEILTPSINQDIKEDVEKLTTMISENPKKLLDRTTISKIKEITKKRITNDRKVIKDKSQDMIKITSLMGKYFDKTLLESENSTSEISNIKEELETLNISPASFREVGLLQSKLVNTIYEIEHSMKKTTKILLQNKSHFDQMQETIDQLEKELENVKEEKDYDSLTKILNRKSFDIELDKIERKYNMFGKNYAIVFYDIDRFRNINDMYGHDCGDAILRTFAGVLNSLTRQNDILARYGGEEFVVLLNYDDGKELTKYLKRVKDIVANRDFNYKGQTIKVEFSAGLSRRNQHKSNEATLKKADELLYKAKLEGRNRIILDNDVQIID